MNKHVVRRLGIFVFYDAVGIVDLYVEQLLESLQAQISKLIIVVNGNITDKSKQALLKFSDDIFIRENKGFDAGAYRDVFLKFLPDTELSKWDEIVLFNDTFYGPISSWNLVFDKMEMENADFWGLSRYRGKDHPSHIQSFFLVCKKKMISDSAFQTFWQGLSYPTTHLEAVENFEIRFSTYFQERNFNGKAYTDICNWKDENKYEGVVYYTMAYELISEMYFPVVKRSVFLTEDFLKAIQVLDYVRECTRYDVNLIHGHIKRLIEENRVSFRFNPLQIEQFCNIHSRVYIYGNGTYGKRIAALLDYCGWKYKGFLVTEKIDSGMDVHAYGEIDLNQDDGIILALGKKAFSEVYPILKNDLANSQLLLPHDDSEGR